MIDLDLLDRLAAEATSGPWDATPEDDSAPDDVRVCYLRDGEHCEWCIALAGQTEDGEKWTAETIQRWRSDAAFIAAARTAVPELVAEVRRLREALRRYGGHSRHVAPEYEPCPRYWIDQDCGEDGSTCTCGLDAALAPAATDDKGGGG